MPDARFSLNVRMPTVGESIVATASVMPTLLTSHPVPDQVLQSLGFICEVNTKDIDERNILSHQGRQFLGIMVLPIFPYGSFDREKHVGASILSGAFGLAVSLRFFVNRLYNRRRRIDHRGLGVEGCFPRWTSRRPSPGR